MNIRLRVGLFLLAFTFTPFVFATPTTLNFGTSFVGNSYTESGLTIDATSAEPVRINGIWGLDCCDSGPETFNLTTGGIFDLLSVFINHIDFSDPVTWTGFLNGSMVASDTFNTGGGGTHNFVGLTGVDLVTFSVSGIWTDPSFDNLTYQASSVPVPATLALLGLGLAGLGYTRKRSAF